MLRHLLSWFCNVAKPGNAVLLLLLGNEGHHYPPPQNPLKFSFAVLYMWEEMVQKNDSFKNEGVSGTFPAFTPECPAQLVVHTDYTCYLHSQQNKTFRKPRSQHTTL